MALTTPLLNGFYPAFADIVLRVDGLQIVGVTELNYSDDLKRAKVWGAQKISLGLSNGKYEAQGDMEVQLGAANLLVSTLSAIGLIFGGFRFVPVGVTVSFQPAGSLPLPLVTDSFLCFLGKQDAKQKVSEDPVTRRFDLVIPGAINWNGIPGCVDLNSIGAAA